MLKNPMAMMALIALAPKIAGSERSPTGEAKIDHSAHDDFIHQ